MRKSKGRRSGVRCRNLRQQALAALSFCFIACSGVFASALSDQEALANEQVSVRELMRLETEQALKAARDRAAGLRDAAGWRPRESRDLSGMPRLVAIYGVGNRLMAEVVVNQTVYLYRSGLGLPVGLGPGDDVYMLHRITTSCVEIRKQDASHELCLRPAQWAEK